MKLVPHVGCIRKLAAKLLANGDVEQGVNITVFRFHDKIVDILYCDDFLDYKIQNSSHLL